MTRHGTDVNSELSRREFIGAASVLLAGIAMPVPSPNADAFDALRERWRHLLVGDASSFAAVRARRAELGRLALDLQRSMTLDQPALWPGLPLNDPLGALSSYQRLRTMALAWASPQTPVSGDKALAAAIRDGIEWLRAHALHDVEWTRGGPDGRRLVDRPGAPPIWSRYYDIATGRPIFGDRDKTIHDDVNELSAERRNGYSWFNAGPAKALKAYEGWAARQPRTAR